MQIKHDLVLSEKVTLAVLGQVVEVPIVNIHMALVYKVYTACDLLGSHHCLLIQVYFATQFAEYVPDEPIIYLFVF